MLFGFWRWLLCSKLFNNNHLHGISVVENGVGVGRGAVEGGGAVHSVCSCSNHAALHPGVLMLSARTEVDSSS